MNQTSLSFYRTLNRFFFPKSYSLKFLGIAFLGIHLPLIAFVMYLALSTGWADALPAIIVVLAATLVGTGFTLWCQHHLLAPVRSACHDLRAYRLDRALPLSPDGFEDTAGQLMREARHSIESLDGLMRLKDNLAVGIAHDFRSPLTAIVAASDMLQMNHPENSSTHKLAGMIRRSAQAQAHQVTGLLEAGMSDTGSTFTYAPVKLTSLWQAALDNQALFAQTQGVALNFPSAHGSVGGDQARLLQVMNNLIGNAIKACSSGDIVEIGAEPCHRGIRISVSDNGQGVDPAKLYSALAAPEDDDTATDGDLKLGLGLRMVNNLLALHASKLSIERRPTGGMCFSFDLLAAESPAPGSKVRPLEMAC
ncbi:sensor histidine kinase [Synoicihabitans lomoniglobus]|uniref:histidine kinase n=1 Tax=Synoicihabitans lomoniglobus TaxID=2909285 RepID=A0AAF0CM25_9BACT|nr:HAMP domain-containing histidine kinase [Opitutaceae bacterium LMO-M01]WED63528.1 HAMP domain-containing sensor histidine kinase [Opitutaceae bacterium LMO-M01]